MIFTDFFQKPVGKHIILFVMISLKHNMIDHDTLRDKNKEIICPPSGDSYQPGRSLIREFAVCMKKANNVILGRSPLRMSKLHCAQSAFIVCHEITNSI